MYLAGEKAFLQEHSIPQEEYKKTGLRWRELEEIYHDYLSVKTSLEETANYVFNSLLKIEAVHTVRLRTKEPDHLIEKVIRKKIKDKNRIINLSNYRTEITDLIGIRAIHLFKEEWRPIHEYITQTWDLHEKPKANIRKGDSDTYINQYRKKDIEIKEYESGYRSLHYIIKSSPARELYLAEIQVRTIFEEAWSEIDHKIRYPHNNHSILHPYLLIFNRLAGSADEMGSFIRNLQQEMEKREKDFHLKLTEKDAIILELQRKVEKLNIKEKDLKDLRQGLEQLKSPDNQFIKGIYPGAGESTLFMQG